MYPYGNVMKWIKFATLGQVSRSGSRVLLALCDEPGQPWQLAVQLDEPSGPRHLAVNSGGRTTLSENGYGSDD